MKKQKNYQSGSAPIYIRITVSGKRSETTTGRECEPSRWNTGAGRAIGTKEDTRAFNMQTFGFYRELMPIRLDYRHLFHTLLAIN